ncbi:MAG: hypothetical protein ACODAD_10240 [Planctomycetota bacterium]
MPKSREGSNGVGGDRRGRRRKLVQSANALEEGGGVFSRDDDAAAVERLGGRHCRPRSGWFGCFKFAPEKVQWGGWLLDHGRGGEGVPACHE